ncbi:MAG: DUF2490 domain-containing protein [Cyclobacteriaceae bacterium]|nr:DUF2490 domain-containing protein [Cyclobacteriaceae bacterium]
MKKKLVTILCSLPLSLAAQSGFGSWNIFNVKATVSDKWSFFAEGQIRSLQFYNNFHYYEYKAGVNYSLSKDFTLTAAVGDYNTYQQGGDFLTPKLSDEFRSWQQITMTQYFSRLKFEHRYRFEQRFTQNGYRPRFRYRLNLVIPINHKKIETGTWYANVSNEIFITSRLPYFERNRFFAGIGYKLTPIFNIQSGYLYQTDYQLVDEIGRDFFQISFLIDLNFAKERKEKMPVDID